MENPEHHLRRTHPAAGLQDHELVQRGGWRRAGHEMSHMWFGDLVTMVVDDCGSTNRSPRGWATDHEPGLPELDMRARAAITDDATPWTTNRRPRDPPEVVHTVDLLQIADAWPRQGPVHARHVRELMGPETFRNGVVDYLSEHAWKNATAADCGGPVARGQEGRGRRNVDVPGPGRSAL